MSATVDGGISVGYRPAGNDTVRRDHPSRVDKSDNSRSTGTSRKSGVLTPAHALVPSRLALISTEPVGRVNRRRTPVDDARNVVAISWRAYPYNVSGPRNPRASDAASAPNTSAPVAATARSQSPGSSDPVISGALSRASGAARAASSLAATTSRITAGSTSLVCTDPTCALSKSRTTEITDIDRLDDTPLVVIELFAHRSDASARSVTITIVSLTFAAANASSTTCWRDQCPASVIVFNTRTPRNSADGQPWLTAATCPGCALPQLNAPPSRHVDSPPTASSDPQKSVVVAW